MHILKLPLNTSAYDEQVLDKRFRLLCRGHNVIVKHAKKLLRALKRNRKYQCILGEYVSLKKKAENKDHHAIARRKVLAEEMGAIRKETGLTETGLQEYGKVFQKSHRDHISSQMMQKEASRVWKGVEKVLFGNGKDVHFKKSSQMHTLPSKSPTNGIRFYDDLRDYTPASFKPKYRAGVVYLGLEIPVRNYEKLLEDEYIQEALCSELKYVYISREMFNSGFRYYAVLALDGPAPKKIPESELGHGTAGGDQGTSTCAVAGENGLLLEELSPMCAEYNSKITKLMREIDRSTRKSNPDNYNANGTVKKRREIKGWTFTKNCLRKKRELTTLFRKKAAYIKDEHNERANRVVRMCDCYIDEKMSFAALAKRSSKKMERSDKESKIRAKDGSTKTIRKFKKKKRFGKSINDRAPAYQSTAIKNKMLQYGGSYLETDTASMKASQYCHDSGRCVKTKLKDRFKTIAGHEVQRDLYSAFITSHADESLSQPMRDACIEDFSHFCEMHDKLIAAMKADGKSRPWCFGF